MDETWKECIGMMVFADENGFICGCGCVINGEFTSKVIGTAHKLAPNIAEPVLEYRLKGVADDFTPEQCRQIAQYFLDRAVLTEEFYNETLHD